MGARKIYLRKIKEVLSYNYFQFILNFKKGIVKYVYLSILLCLFISCNKKEESGEKEIISFFFNHFDSKQSILINEEKQSIICYVPNKENIQSWVPTIVVSDVATVTPASGVANDFSQPHTYSVTAEDGSVKTYTVEVLCDQNAIISFSFAHFSQEVFGTIDKENKTITCLVPDKIGINDWAPTIKTSDGAVVSPTSGIANDFSQPCTYTVLAENGVIEEYLVKVLNTQNTITSFSLNASANNMHNNIDATITENKIIIETQQWIDHPEALIVTFASEGSVSIAEVVQESNLTANDFRQNIIYTVTAESGAVKEYAVQFISPLNTGLPVFKINTEGNIPVVNKIDDIKATIKLIGEKEEYNFEQEGEIRGRGNSTLTFPKKPYRLKFDKKTPVLGLRAEKKWVLLANYLDPTLILNTVAFELGHQFGLPFTNHVRHVEVFLNNEYRGSYLLTEQIEVTSNRVNINEKKGFLVELDAYMDEDWQFYTEGIGLPVMVKSPDFKTESEMDFVRSAIHELEEALFSDEFPNTNYKDLIDIDMLINFLLVNEICFNGELHWPKSTYMYRDVGKKISMGPLWDFDWGSGYQGVGHDYFTHQGILFYQGFPGDFVGGKFFSRFFDDPDFRESYKNRWNELKATQFGNIYQYVDNVAVSLERSLVENRKIWDTGYDAKEQIKRMKQWLLEREVFLDERIQNF